MDISFFVLVIVLSQTFPYTYQENMSEACYSNGHINSCYGFSESQSNFSTSKSSCESMGMHLVYIESLEEQDFLGGQADVKQYWIGLSSVVWLDGSDMAYTNFPDLRKAFDDGGSCFRLVTKSRLWHDANCSSTHHFICEKEGSCCPNYAKNGSSCYLFSQNELDFFSSKSFCESLGMHLVYIGSKEEEDFLLEDGNDGYQYWMGLASVTWLDGSSLIYNNFPNPVSAFDSGGHCYRMRPTSFKWYDSTCNEEYYYICEKEDGTSSGPVTPIPSSMTTARTSATPSSQVTTSTTGSCPRDTSHTRSSSFELLADNVALVEDYVTSSYTASSVMRCGKLCLVDAYCAYFTYIELERACFLGEICLGADGSNFELRSGAKTYSTI